MYSFGFFMIYFYVLQANDSHIDTNDNLGIKTFQIQMANSTGKTGWDGMISNDDLDYQVRRKTIHFPMKYTIKCYR